MSSKIDIENVDQISPEILDFTYKNSIEYLKSTIESKKAISDKSFILLSYLFIAIGFFIHNASLYIKDKHIDYYFFGLWVLVIIYYAFIIGKIIYYAKPSKAFIPYVEPEHILQKNIIIEGYHNIILLRCMEIQNDINANRIILNTMSEKFESALSYTLVLPAIFKFLRKFIFCWIYLNRDN